MPPRFRRITPLPAWHWLYAFNTVVMALAIAFQVIAMTLTRVPKPTIWSLFVFIPLGVFSAQRLGRGIRANPHALLLQNGPRSPTVRLDAIDTFVWRQNLHNLGEPGKRLWVLLHDGQACPTSVVIGRAFLRPDVVLTADRANTLLADLEQRRAAAAGGKTAHIVE